MGFKIAEMTDAAQATIAKYKLDANHDGVIDGADRDRIKQVMAAQTPPDIMVQRVGYVVDSNIDVPRTTEAALRINGVKSSDGALHMSNDDLHGAMLNERIFLIQWLDTVPWFSNIYENAMLNILHTTPMHQRAELCHRMVDRGLADRMSWRTDGSQHDAFGAWMRPYLWAVDPSQVGQAAFDFQVDNSARCQDMLQSIYDHGTDDADKLNRSNSAITSVLALGMMGQNNEPWICWAGPYPSGDAGKDARALASLPEDIKAQRATFDAFLAHIPAGSGRDALQRRFEDTHDLTRLRSRFAG